MRILISMFIMLMMMATLEIYSISWVWSKIGGFNTFLLVFGTGIIGAFIARNNAKLAITQLAKGGNSIQHQGKKVFDAISFFLAAALLLIPGIITDIAGLLLLLPVTRNLIFTRFILNSEPGRQFSTGFNKGKSTRKNSLDSDSVIDIKAEEVK